MFNHYYIYLLAYIPVSALIFFSFLRLLKWEYNYAESTIVSCLATAQVIVLQAVGLLIAALVDDTSFTRTQDVVVALSGALLFSVLSTGANAIFKSKANFILHPGQYIGFYLGNAAIADTRPDCILKPYKEKPAFATLFRK